MRSHPAFFLVLSFGLFLCAAPGPFAQITTDQDSLCWKPRPFDRPIDPDTYIVRPGELLKVIFINAKLPAMNLEVDAEGKIVHRSLGVFDLSNCTLSEARELLAEPLSRMYNADKIAISISSIYSVSIQVTGAVRNPGRYLAYTSQTVAEVVDLAGGVTPAGSTRRVVFSGGARDLQVDLDRAVFLGDNSLNPNLYAGRVVYVPTRSGSAVQVVGQVDRPRLIELMPGDGLDLLVGLAGGARQSADIAAAYSANDPSRDIHRSGEIKPGDVIVVPPIASMSESSELTVLGAVNRPGRYVCRVGMKVSDLLEAAGGLEEHANAERVTVFRVPACDAMGNQVVGRYPILVGGSSQLTGKQLQPGDSVYIPVRLGYVKVTGLVARPGLYPYEKATEISNYIRMAGGFLDDADRREVGIFDRISGLTRSGSIGETLSDGDEVVIHQRELGP